MSDEPVLNERSAAPATKGWWFIAAVVLLVALTGYSRGTAPWRLPVMNDEMKHLESWRNQYRTDDIYPLFLEKVEKQGWLEGKNLERMRALYHSGPLVQRALLVAIDGHPPLFPVIVEVIEAVTKSSLVAARLPSAIASALAVFFMYRLGRALRDETLGLWLATLVAIGFLAQVYAGISRSYALAQFAMVLSLDVYVREQRTLSKSPARLWLVFLFAQSTHWLTWSLVGPLVIIELIRRLRAGVGFGRLVRQTWWYALISVGLLALLALHMTNPGIGGVQTVREGIYMWYHYRLASPFAAVDQMLGVDPFTPLSPSGLTFVVLVVLGLGAVIGDPAFSRRRDDMGLALPTVRIALPVLAVVAIVTSSFFFSATRFMLVYAIGPTVLAGIGVHWLLGATRASQILVVVVLAAMSVLSIGWPQDPYTYLFFKETDYEAIAERLKAEMKEGDAWCAYPYFHGDCLFPYGPLPAPERPVSEREFRLFLDALPRRDQTVFVLVRASRPETPGQLLRVEEQWEFFNHYRLAKIPPRPRW